MNILVLGGGGREHALVWALAKSARCENIFVAPGNGGTAKIATNIPSLDIEDGAAVAGFSRDNAIDLVVVGPEAPLVAGVANACRAAGISCFGPDAQGALLEGSKHYSKQFMDANGIPTARYQSFTECEAALAFAQELGLPAVIKADGLAAGKGVMIVETESAAREAIESCFDGAFGEAGKTVLIEEFLSGPECSLLAFVSQGKARFLQPAQDHKRAFDGDLGPNTGGMGAYSPVPIVSGEELFAMQEIMEKAAAATARPPFKNDYRGILYGGFMLTPQGPMVLEFNVRFGDPETQAVLTLLESDLLDVVEAVAGGRPEDIELSWSEDFAVCVVLASGGYPGAYEKGKVILGIDEAETLPGVVVFHAGTGLNSDDEFISSGGRVLDVVALGNSFEQARARAYDACKCINFEGRHYRGDIGKRAAAGRDAWSD